MLLKRIVTLFTGLSLSWAVLADNAMENATIEQVKLTDSIYVLVGPGGNIGVSVGEDGTMIIDDKYAPLATKIATALGQLGSQPKYIINTHYHGDHTGGNGFFVDKHMSTIFAHENVRIQLAKDKDVKASALPVVTYEEGIKLYFNGDTLQVTHLPAGHTDGDSVVWFTEANVLHTGDLFFNGLFPYIDLSSGGTVEGYIASVKHLLAQINDETVIIPGHGEIATKQDYLDFLTMIEATKAYVDSQKAKGVSEDDLINKGLPAEWKKWSWAFITEEKWIKTLYH